MKNFFCIILLSTFFISCSSPKKTHEIIECKLLEIKDTERNRNIPVAIYQKAFQGQFNQLTLINAGYGSSATEYTYLAQKLAKDGHLVVCIQHEIDTDPPIPVGKEVYQKRLPMWKEGCKSIDVVLKNIQEKKPKLVQQKINLIGHSNGGDISVLYAINHPERIKKCISLDHRRVPFPRNKKVPFLTLRGIDYQADTNVLPVDEEEAKKMNLKVISFEDIKHSDFRDKGSLSRKKFILKEVLSFLKN